MTFFLAKPAEGYAKVFHRLAIVMAFKEAENDPVYLIGGVAWPVQSGLALKPSSGFAIADAQGHDLCFAPGEP